MAGQYRFKIRRIERDDNYQGEWTTVHVTVELPPNIKPADRSVSIDGHPQGAALERQIRAKLDSLAKEIDRQETERSLVGQVIEIEVKE